MSIEKYIELFDKTFGTNLSKSIIENEKIMLDWAFNNLGEDLYAQSRKCIEISKKKLNVSNKLDETLSDKQKELFEEYFVLDGELSADIERQLLIFGYCLCYQELKEMGSLKI